METCFWNQIDYSQWIRKQLYIYFYELLTIISQLSVTIINNHHYFAKLNLIPCYFDYIEKWLFSQELNFWWSTQTWISEEKIFIIPIMFFNLQEASWTGWICCSIFIGPLLGCTNHFHFIIDQAGIAFKGIQMAWLKLVYNFFFCNFSCHN